MEEGRELPVGWAACDLGEVCEIIRGITFPASAKEHCKTEDNVCCLRTSNIQRELDWKSVYFVSKAFVNKPSQLVRLGDVLMSMANSYELVGKVSVARQLPCETAFGAFLAALRPTQALTDQFLFHFLRSESVQSQIREGSSQTTNIANVSAARLREIVIPLAPLNEQRRIAAKLDATLAAVDACRQRLDGVEALLKRFRQAVLAAATSGELTREWRVVNPLNIDTANNEIASLVEARLYNRMKVRNPLEPDLSHWESQPPASWMVGSVSMIAECLDNQRIPVKKEKRKSAKGLYPYYGANGMVDMVDEYIFDGEIVLVTEDETFYGREKPIAYRSSGKCWVNNHAHVLKPQDSITADYLCYALMHYPVLPWLTGATGRAKLTQAVLNCLPIAIPPAAEMREIVIQVKSLFSLADQLEARLSAARKIVERLTPALLAKAFRGELVPQDPNDEPASVLLERIRAARQAEAAVSGPSRRGRKKAAANPDSSPVDAAPVPPDRLANLLRECGALSERALLAASELDPVSFQAQLTLERELGAIQETLEDGQVLLEVVA
ncbi:MAG: restriction endonuclease subunit S [Cyanobium sp.]